MSFENSFDCGKYFLNLKRFYDAKKSFAEALVYANDDIKKCIRAINAKGAALDSLGNHDDALACFEDALCKLKEAETKGIEDLDILLALVYHNKGYTYGNMKKYGDSIVCFKKAIGYFEKSGQKYKDDYKTEFADTLRNFCYVKSTLIYTVEKEISPEIQKEIVEDFNKAFELDNDSASLYNTLGHIYGVGLNYKKAIECFDKSLKMDGNNVLPYYNKGYSCYYLGKISENGKDYVNARSKYLESISYFDTAIEKDSNFIYSWYYKGRVLYAGLKLYEESLKCIEICLEKNPNFALGWYDKGIVLRNLNRNNEAVVCFDKAIKLLKIKLTDIDQNHAYILNAKGAALDSLGNHDDALACFEDALCKLKEAETKGIEDLDILLALVYHNKGYTYGNMKKYGDSIVCFKKAIGYFEKSGQKYKDDYKTEFADTLRNMGYAFAKEQNYELAECSFNRALDIDKDFAYVWFSKGYFLLYNSNETQVDAAIYCFNESIQCFRDSNFEDKTNSDIVYPLCYKGRAYHLKKDYVNAIKCFHEAINLQPNYSDAWYSKGVSIYSLEKEKASNLGVSPNLKELEKSIMCFDEAIGKDKISYYSWYNKGVILQSIGRYETAIECFDEATKLQPDIFYAWYSKALVLQSIERYASSIECLNQLITHDSAIQHIISKRESSLIWYNIGYSHYCLAKKDPINGEKNMVNYHYAIECFDKSLNEGDDAKDEKDDIESVEKTLIYFLRGTCKYAINDYSGARSDFESVDDSEIDDKRKGYKYNNIGVCFYQNGQLSEKNAEESFNKSIEYDAYQGNAYYNLALLYNRQKKNNKAKTVLEQAPKDLVPVKDSITKNQGSTNSNWYDWWFDNSKTKKIMGIAMIVSLLSPLVGVAIMIQYVYVFGQDLTMRSALSSFIGANLALLLSGLTVLMAIIVCILLLPSLQKFKIGTIELETLPTVSENFDKILSVPNLADIVSPNVKDFPMPIEYKAHSILMPVKYTIQPLFIEIDYLRGMPNKILHV